MTFGATILDAEGQALTPDEIALFKDADPFGFILFARNIDSADQLMRLCDQMRDAVGRDAPILIDQEGGRVARMKPPVWQRYPAGEGQAYVIGGLTASYLRKGDVVLIPIRVGAGLRLGINAGYMKFSKKQRWLPF